MISERTQALPLSLLLTLSPSISKCTKQEKICINITVLRGICRASTVCHVLHQDWCDRSSVLSVRNLRSVPPLTPLAWSLSKDPEESHRQQTCKSHRRKHNTDKRRDSGSQRGRKGKLNSVIPETYPPFLRRGLEKTTLCLLAWVTLPTGVANTMTSSLPGGLSNPTKRLSESYLMLFAVP